MKLRTLAVPLICLVTVVRIAATHGVFSPTWDEPIHVNAGHEYLTGHRYTQDPQHPPLARIAIAWPLRHATPDAGGWERPAQIYDSAGLGSTLAHPDYLPWMNAIAGKHPERVLVDSNLDWGQDILRLSHECRRLGITQLRADLFGTTDLRRIGLPPVSTIDPTIAAPGWYAFSETQIVTAQASDPNAFRWLTDNYEFRRVGESIRLYRVR